MSRGIKHTDLMGWCMPNAEDHEHCRTEYTDMRGEIRRCGCTCHAQPAPKKRTTRKAD